MKTELIKGNYKIWAKIPKYIYNIQLERKLLGDEIKIRDYKDHDLNHTE